MVMAIAAFPNIHKDPEPEMGVSNG